MKFSEKWGDSIEVAVKLALQELKLTEDKVKVTVLEEPSKGFFGIGSKLAHVRVEEIQEVKQKPVISEAKQKNSKKSNSTVETKKRSEESKAEEIKSNPKKETTEKEHKKKNKNNKKNENQKVTIETKQLNISAKPENLVADDNHPAKEFLENTFKEMGIEVKVSVSVTENCVYAEVEGKDTGTVIGKRGQTLDSLQYLTSLVVNRGEDEYIRVILDAEGYRAKREATLQALAIRLAEKVIKTGKKTRLEPMNPLERKIIHTTLQGVEGINTRSEGDEPYRRVVIEPKR